MRKPNYYLDLIQLNLVNLRHTFKKNKNHDDKDHCFTGNGGNGIKRC